MCRMIFAKGNFDASALIDDVITMALDKNEKHEENENRVFQHSDGWGICFPENGKLVVHRSIKPIFDDPDIEFFRKLKAKFMVVHARKASYGGEGLKNTHPFTASFNGEQFCFFHNGTVYDDLEFSEVYRPLGTTDSEKYFYYLLSQTKLRLIKSGLKQKLLNLKNFTGANFIMISNHKAYIATWYAANPKYYTMKIFQDRSSLIISSEIPPHYQDRHWKKLNNRTILSIDL